MASTPALAAEPIAHSPCRLPVWDHVQSSAAVANRLNTSESDLASALGSLPRYLTL